MINFDRLYDYRFRNVDQSSRQRVWNVIAEDIYLRMGCPEVVLDPAAGRCEFMNAIPAKERWVIDRVHQDGYRDPGIAVIIANVFDAELPASHFEGVFVSNFLEHLDSPAAVAALLSKLNVAMQSGGRIAVMGPNFKYCAREYFDCADHVLAMSHIAVEEHLYAAGFIIDATLPRYLPFSFRGILPPSPTLTRAYLNAPLARHLLGKQFLIVATKPASEGL